MTTISRQRKKELRHRALMIQYRLLDSYSGCLDLADDLPDDERHFVIDVIDSGVQAAFNKAETYKERNL